MVDLGAGTGRLAIPLAEEGYRVTAVDPSAAMLDVLTARTEAKVACVTSTAAAFSSDSEVDLVLCVFSVLTYITGAAGLSRTLHTISRVLNPSGHLIVSIPSPEVLHSYEHETDDMDRRVDVEDLGDSLFRYRERTRVLISHVWRSFEDEFDLRLWTRSEVMEAAQAAGMVEAADVSADFEDWGAEYLILEKAIAPA